MAAFRKSVSAIGLAAVAVAAPAAASQPIWQPAIYCAALDLTRAEILAELDESVRPELAGGVAAAELSGRTYLRIAAEALECPPAHAIDAMLATARIGIEHRIALAAAYGHGPEVTVLPLASESELVCRLNFDARLLAEARNDEEMTPPAPLCDEAL